MVMPSAASSVEGKDNGSRNVNNYTLRYIEYYSLKDIEDWSNTIKHYCHINVLSYTFTIVQV